MRQRHTPACALDVRARGAATVDWAPRGGGAASAPRPGCPAMAPGPSTCLCTPGGGLTSRKPAWVVGRLARGLAGHRARKRPQGVLAWFFGSDSNPMGSRPRDRLEGQRRRPLPQWAQCGAPLSLGQGWTPAFCCVLPGRSPVLRPWGPGSPGTQGIGFLRVLGLSLVQEHPTLVVHRPASPCYSCLVGGAGGSSRFLARQLRIPKSETFQATRVHILGVTPDTLLPSCPGCSCHCSEVPGSQDKAARRGRHHPGSGGWGSRRPMSGA